MDCVLKSMPKNKSVCAAIAKLSVLLPWLLSGDVAPSMLLYLI
jgi:hypothetical protein